MIRISLPWVIDVVASLDRLDALQAGKVDDHFLALLAVQVQIEQLFNGSIYRHFLRASRERAQELYDAVKVIVDREGDKDIAEWEVHQIQNARHAFYLVFRSEIALLPVFLVSRKATYDLALLIEQGTELFPRAMLAKAPETEEDALEVGKCLAFELNTACGFHTFRVVEAVARRYWDTASGGKPRPHPETLGQIAGQLEIQNLGEPKVCESLKSLTKLHRNPLAHPDVILTADEAIATVGMAGSVVTHMLAALPDVLPTTGAPSGP